jgi:ubiquinone biosynthesis protein COQ9
MVMTKPETTLDNRRDRQQDRDRLLLAILPHVTFDGWTDAAFRAGTADCGLETIAFRRFFPGGAGEIIAHFSHWADRQMVAAFGDQETDDLRLRERVTLAVRLRLEALVPHREAVRRTLSVLALPTNAVLAMRSLYGTVDSVWYEVGDRSADFNFYSKRALLAAVVSSTTLYWLDDETEGCGASWAFLDRRIANVMKIPSLTQRVSRLTERLPDPFALLRAGRLRTRQP